MLGRGIAALLRSVAAWAEERSDVVGVALVGSYARDTAKASSDIDLVILSDSPADLLGGGWLARFGDVDSSSVEDYGAVKSRRVFYRNGLEIEFGVAARSWASVPVDADTRRVLTGGVKVLYDPKKLLRAANEAVSA
jgi:predicted nucleotidyltransferase